MNNNESMNNHILALRVPFFDTPTQKENDRNASFKGAIGRYLFLKLVRWLVMARDYYSFYGCSFVDVTS